MTAAPALLLASRDPGLIAHWKRAFGSQGQVLRVVSSFAELSACLQGSPLTVWLDLDLPGTPAWKDAQWQALLRQESLRLVATASSPNDETAIAALDAGCVGYCHAFADVATLAQVLQVVQVGQVWVGKNLMHRLLHGARALAPSGKPAVQWDQGLTQREREVALLAANGASNSDIATECSISERTVKAHLTAVFAKINITDRLQLALRVHGIS